MLEFWGTSDLIGLQINIQPGRWPSQKRIHEILEHFPPEEEALDLRTLQMAPRPAKNDSPPFRTAGDSGVVGWPSTDALERNGAHESAW